MKMISTILVEMSTLEKVFALLNGEKLLKVLFQIMSFSLTSTRMKMMILQELLQLGGKL